jgi:protein-L-isoaspartate(D-aspartate) O-methyltransferase
MSGLVVKGLRTAVAGMGLLALAGLLGILVMGQSGDVGRAGGRMSDALEEAEHRGRRHRLVDFIEAGGVTDPAVLAALRAVPRHRFVPASLQDSAYADTPLPIGSGQTISQPSLVALMTAAIRPRRTMRVLEVGTGSGYQAAVLAESVGEVDSIEILPDLGRKAAALLTELGYRNVRVRIGDGYDGWPERAPYDAILLTAAPEQVPRPLLDQLRLGGRLVAPVGKGVQDLVVITRTAHGTETEVIEAVRFVPMTGKAQADR